MQADNQSLFFENGNESRDYHNSNESIQRILSLQVENFRGIRQLDTQSNTLNTDADIILITGPNGFGKTSLVDALCLLLTGHHYQERDSLLFLQQGLQIVSSTIQADVLFANDEKSKSVSVEVPNNKGKPGKPFATGLTWPRENLREIVARSCFFYQDLLHRLFDEEGAENTLYDYLTPPPPQVEDARKAIAYALKQLKNEEARLFSLPDFPSEEEIKGQRITVARAFLEAWSKLWQSAVSINIHIPKRTNNWLLGVRGDLLSGWKEALRNLANECLEVYAINQLEPLEKNTEPSISLKRIESMLPDIKTQIAAQLKGKQQLAVLVDALPDDAEVILESEAIEEERVKLIKFMAKINALKEDQNVLESLERHFKSPDGPELLEILKALKQYGDEWLNLPRFTSNIADSPTRVLAWLELALTSFELKNSTLDQYLEDWQENIRRKRIEAQDIISKKEQQHRKRTRIVDISSKIISLASQADSIDLIVKQVSVDNNGQITKETLNNILYSNQSRKGSLLEDPLSAIRLVEDSISDWYDVELRDKDRESRLRRLKGYEEAREHCNSVRKALESEASKASSLMEKILELPEAEMKRFASLVNQVFSGFRTVPGLHPIKFKKGYKTQGRSRLNTWDIFAGDGRPLDALSTGQKAQLGLSMLLSLNMILSPLISHSVIALDDTTTALDMAQLPREAVLLRQIAYGDNDSNQNHQRRQIFIVSHHEALTNRLVDFLIPPEGRTMHIFNFTNWRAGNAAIEQLRVDPALSATKATRAEFATRLSYISRIE